MSTTASSFVGTTIRCCTEKTGKGRLDARGRPEYRPPATIDPERRYRQHLRFATAA